MSAALDSASHPLRAASSGAPAQPAAPTSPGAASVRIAHTLFWGGAAILAAGAYLATLDITSSFAILLRGPGRAREALSAALGVFRTPEPRTRIHEESPGPSGSGRFADVFAPP